MKIFLNSSNYDSIWKKIHKYTPKSVTKTVYLNVFLGSQIISQEFYSKTAIQQLSEN